jgi:uncharacterized DUF497 family protein
MYVRFASDPIKEAANPKNHPGITFKMAEEVFDDPSHVVLENYYIEEDGEQRMQAIGMSGKMLLLLVVFVDRSTDREIVIHIISARKANAYDQTIYEDQFR